MFYATLFSVAICVVSVAVVTQMWFPSKGDSELCCYPRSAMIQDRATKIKVLLINGTSGIPVAFSSIQNVTIYVDGEFSELLWVTGCQSGAF